MIRVLPFLAASLLSSLAFAHGADGFVRLAGADCVVKGASHVGSVVVRIDGTEAKIQAYKGARNPINPYVGMIASGTGKVHSMVGFPNNNTETVAIRLDEDMAKVMQRPRLVLTAKIYKADSEVPIMGHLANPMGEEDDFQLQCTPFHAQTQKDYHVIDTSKVQRAKHPSLCTIEFRDERTPNWTHGCTATIIADKTLLTAAHCQESFARKDTRVQCGEDSQWRQILQWKNNPAHRPKDHPISNPHDISVIMLDSTGTAPAVAMESSTPEVERLVLENRNCRHYGMGNRQDGSVGTLYTSKYRIHPEILGGKAFVERIFEMTNMIVGDPSYFIRSGDSGGPMICQNAQGQDVIVGVNSFISAASTSAFMAMTSRSWDFLGPYIK